MCVSTCGFFLYVYIILHVHVYLPSCKKPVYKCMIVLQVYEYVYVTVHMYM